MPGHGGSGEETGGCGGRRRCRQLGSTCKWFSRDGPRGSETERGEAVGWPAAVYLRGRMGLGPGREKGAAVRGWARPERKAGREGVGRPRERRKGREGGSDLFLFFFSFYFYFCKFILSSNPNPFSNQNLHFSLEIE